MTFNFGDRERNGSILRNDCWLILFSIWPEACSGDRLTLKLAMEKYMRRFNVGTRQEPYVSYRHWKEMCKRFPRLILPFKKLQYSWCVKFMGVKWWDKKKLDLEKARNKIIKDMGLAERKKIIAKELGLNNDNDIGLGSSSEEEEEV